jgi:hypothetical protein
MDEWMYRSTILNLDSRMRVVNFAPLSLFTTGEEAPVPIEEEAAWAQNSW